jgi:uncharacterized protein YkwD
MLRKASIVLALLSVSLAVPLGASATSTSASSVAREPSLEALVLQRINELRAANGLSAWTASSGLTKAAVAHSRSMVLNGFFAHESRNGAPFWERVKTFYGPRARGWTVGENLAMFGGAKPDADAILQAWIASPPHRANLLSKFFANAGIAILYDPAAGGVYGGGSTWVVTLDLGAR